jgi:hypothetical protein
MRPVPVGGLAAQEGAALFVFFGAQILKKIQNGHNTNHGLVADFTQSPKIFSRNTIPLKENQYNTQCLKVSCLRGLSKAWRVQNVFIFSSFTRDPPRGHIFRDI